MVFHLAQNVKSRLCIKIAKKKRVLFPSWSIYWNSFVIFMVLGKKKKKTSPRALNLLMWPCLREMHGVTAANHLDTSRGLISLGGVTWRGGAWCWKIQTPSDPRDITDDVFKGVPWCRGISRCVPANLFLFWSKRNKVNL